MPTRPLAALLVALAAMPAKGEEHDEAPVYLTGRSKSAREVEPGCVLRNLQLPEGVARPCAITVKLAVSRTGTASRISIPGGDQPPALEEALARAARACAWRSGELEGKPASTWLLLPLRLQAPCDEARPASADFPQRVRETSCRVSIRERREGCLAEALRDLAHRLEPNGDPMAAFISLGASGAVRSVDVRGATSDAMKAGVEAAIRSCEWLPCENLEGKLVDSWKFQPIDLPAGSPALGARGRGLAAPHTPPREENEGCAVRSVQLPPVLRGPRPVAVQFTVTAEGRAEAVEIVDGPATAELRAGFDEAIRDCRWRAGLDAQGRPVTARVRMSFTFAENSFFEGDGRNPVLSSQPREASERCVVRAIERSPFDPGYRDVYVRFRVSADGTAEQFSIKPEGVDAGARMKLIDAFTSCSWIPGADAQGKPVAAWIVYPIRFR